jgi:hypothetical protein
MLDNSAQHVDFKGTDYLLSEAALNTCNSNHLPSLNNNIRSYRTLSPIVPVLAVGKRTELLREPGFHSLCGRPSMHVISSLLWSVNSAQKSAQCGANNLGQPQARQRLQSSNDCSITFCEPDRSFLGFGAHVSLQLALDFSRADVCRTYSQEISACEIGSLSDAARFQTVALPPKPSPFAFEWLISRKSKTLPEVERLRREESTEFLSERVMARLTSSEAHETDIWLRQDYRQAFICVSLAAKGNTEPFVVASYQVYGIHPDKVWPKILWNRQARLGREFPVWYDASGMMKPDLPKKPSTYSNPEAEKFCKDRLPLPSPDTKETA